MNRQQTRGVILLLVIIVALQFAFRNCEFRHTFTLVETTLGYREMDSLRALATALKKETIYPPIIKASNWGLLQSKSTVCKPFVHRIDT